MVFSPYGLTEGLISAKLSKLLKIYLSYSYDFKLGGHLGAQKIHSTTTTTTTTTTTGIISWDLTAIPLRRDAALQGGEEERPLRALPLPQAAAGADGEPA